MSIYSEIKQAFPQLVVSDISDYYSNEIEPAKKIYQGQPNWKCVKSSGIKKKSRDRSLLNMAKVVCDKMAALTFSEQCDIDCGNEEYEEIIKSVLSENAFNSHFPEWLSRAYALGGGVLKVNIIGQAIKIDYLNADTFFPTKWDNRHITGGVFRSSMARGGKHYRIYEHVIPTKNGLTLEHSAWESDSKKSMGNKVSISEILPETPDKTDFNGIKTSLFTYFKPAIGNNKCFDLPLGIPIFANCYDTLEEIDVVFDSLQREFILGKKRVILPEELIKTAYDEDGNKQRYFDVDDEVYQAFTGDIDKIGINDITIPLRVQEHCEALKNLLDILSMQLGLSPGSLSFNRSDGLKTATEVVANERDTMRTVENQKNIVTECIIELCKSIIAAYCYIHQRPYSEFTVTVSWQDNVVSDDDTRIKQNIDLVSAGLRSKKQALININGYSNDKADEELAEINAEASSGGETVDSIFGGGE